MKTYHLVTFLFFGIVSFIAFDAVHNSADSHTSGAPAIRTGSPGDGGATCKNCHAGPNPVTEIGLITSNIPPDGYSAGQTYTITATVARSGHTKFGFEISPQNIAGSLLGTLIVTNTTEMQLVGTGKYITHKAAGVSGTNSRTWEFDWTAPAAGTGDVTFYGAFNITNAMNNSAGDTTVLSTLTVSECAAPSPPGNIGGPDVICSNAIVNYVVSPVAGATSYNWTFPAGWTMIGPSSESIQVQTTLNSGSISVTVSNACGTSQASTLAVSIDQLDAASVSTGISCFGGSDGTATATPVSGVGPYQYLWSPGGQTTATAVNLIAGTYDVTITDDAGCSSSSTTTVNEPPPLQLNSFSTNANCGGSDGTAGVNVNGGTPNYTYEWNSNPPQTSQVAINLSAGIYIVIVTDQNGCIASSSASVTTAAGPAASAMVVSNVRCFDGNDGEAVANVSNGTAPFTYQWVPSGGSDSVAQNLHAGAYSVTVTDVNGCTSSASVTITEPSLITLNATTIDAACGQSNGSASVVATGGAGGYTYHWNSIPVQTNATATNLPAGSYIVTVTDANGCIMTETVGVSDISGPALQAGTFTNVTCFGGSDGTLSVIASGGTGPYTFQWAPSGGSDTIARNLHAGAYSVTVSDASGCISVLTGIVTEPAELVAQPGPDIMLCNGESVLLGISPVATGGVGGYTYLWSPAGTLNNANDSMPVASPSNSTDYMLLITDGNGCTDSAYVLVTVNPVPAAPVITANTDSLFSTSGSAYQWYLNGFILPGATSQIYVPLQSGNYSVIVTDVNGCTSVSADYFFDYTPSANIIDEKTFEVFPNPAAQTLFIRFSKSENVEMQIVNLTGQRIMSSHPKATSDLYTLDISLLERGVYVLEITGSSGNNISRKVFIRE
jgi:hypothetical protein